MSAKINKSKLTKLILVEINKALNNGTLINEGTIAEDIAEYMLAVNFIKQRLELIKTRGEGNPQLIADLLAKIHSLVRPEGNIQDLFTKTKAAETASQRVAAQTTKKTAAPATAAPSGVEKVAAE